MIMDTEFALNMTLRDYFAAKAMQALIERLDYNTSSQEAVARIAYTYAEAMMEEQLNR